MRISTILVMVGIGSLCLSAPSAIASPDAVLDRIVAEGSDLREGDSLHLSVYVSNRGKETLPPVPVSLMVDDDTFADIRLDKALSPGETTSWSLSWTATRGSHVIAARVDPLNDIPESNERNNTGYISLGVGAAREPSPWPPILAGLAAFGIGAIAAFLAKRSIFSPRPPAGKKAPSSNGPAGRVPPTER